MIYKTGECNIVNVFTSGDTVTCEDCGCNYSLFFAECPRCSCPNADYIGVGKVLIEEDKNVD